MPPDSSGRLHAASGVAHAKGILIGEHAAVYGRPAIALPITTLRTVAEVIPGPGPLRLSADGYTLAVTDLPERFASVGVAAHVALEHFGLPVVDLEIAVSSDIPPRAGLGASAAAAGAIVEAVRVYAGQRLDEATRFELVQRAEQVAHGNPSGIDAHATRAAGPLVFADGRCTPLDVRAPMWFVVADTGMRASTDEAVAGVRRTLDADPARGAELLDRLEELTLGTVQDLELGRVSGVGQRLTAAQQALDALGVGHESIDRLVAAATEAGAAGGKLTGSGRGGCVIAVAADAEQAQAVLTSMISAGALAGWVVPVGAG